MIIIGTFGDTSQTWLIPHSMEVGLALQKAIYTCVKCSKKDKEGTNPEYYHIYHLADNIAETKNFDTQKELKLHLNKLALLHEAELNKPKEIPEDMSEPTKPVFFEIWKQGKKTYKEGALILKFIEMGGGVRCRVVDRLGNHIPNGALFYINKNVRLYDHVNPDFGMTLIQNNRLDIKAG